MPSVSWLPAPCKFERESNGHYYIWDGTFRAGALYDLSDPALGLGTAINTLFGVTLTPVFVPNANDDEFQVFKNFIDGS